MSTNLLSVDHLARFGQPGDAHVSAPTGRGQMTRRITSATPTPQQGRVVLVDVIETRHNPSVGAFVSTLTRGHCLTVTGGRVSRETGPRESMIGLPPVRTPDLTTRRLIDAHRIAIATANRRIAARRRVHDEF